jgi:hypothetical protein
VKLWAEMGGAIRRTRLVPWDVEFGDGTGELCTMDFGDDEKDLNFIPSDLER